MDRAIRLSSLLLALLFALTIGYSHPAAGQAEKTGEDRKAEDAQRKERERQKELERLKASGVDPKKLDRLQPGVDPIPKPPSAPLKSKGFAAKKPTGKTSLKDETQLRKKPRITNKKLDDSLTALSSDHSHTLTGQALPVNGKDKEETPGSRHERSEPHKPELHKHHSGCEALSTQAAVEACKNLKAGSKKQN